MSTEKELTKAEEVILGTGLVFFILLAVILLLLWIGGIFTAYYIALFGCPC